MSLYDSFQSVVSSLGMEKITHPIFYNSQIGIRFNICDNGNDIYLDNDDYLVNPNYISACLERSKKIYHSLKTAPDLLVIEGYLEQDEKLKDFILAVRSAADLPQPEEISSKLIKNDEDEFNNVFLFWSLEDFCPDKLLEEIINADLGGNNLLTSSVYFVCKNDNVLFHLYDDRGADLVADKKEKIQHVYCELNDLILDYNREEIDGIFK